MFRGGAPKVIGPSCCICWMSSFFMHFYIPMKITGPQDTGNDTDTQGRWICSASSPSASIVILWSISDAMFIGLMVWSSGSLVLLHRHHQGLQHIHIPNGSHRCSPKTRATDTTLMLVVTVTFYMLDSIFALHITVFRFPSMVDADHSCLSFMFPTISPLLLSLRDPRTPRFCS